MITVLVVGYILCGMIFWTWIIGTMEPDKFVKGVKIVPSILVILFWPVVMAGLAIDGLG